MQTGQYNRTIQCLPLHCSVLIPRRLSVNYAVTATSVELTPAVPGVQVCQPHLAAAVEPRQCRLHSDFVQGKLWVPGPWGLLRRVRHRQRHPAEPSYAGVRVAIASERVALLLPFSA